MTLRKMLPATLLLLAACTASTASTAETASVGMNPDAKAGKACCAKTTECTPEQKAACAEEKVGECEKPADATKP